MVILLIYHTDCTTEPPSPTGGKTCCTGLHVAISSSIYIGTVTCQPGTHVRGKNCRLCPIGQYTDQSDQNACIQCPEGKTTAEKGASSVTQCVGKCVMSCDVI